MSQNIFHCKLPGQYVFQFQFHQLRIPTVSSKCLVSLSPFFPLTRWTIYLQLTVLILVFQQMFQIIPQKAHCLCPGSNMTDLSQSLLLHLNKCSLPTVAFFFSMSDNTIKILSTYFMNQRKMFLCSKRDSRERNIELRTSFMPYFVYVLLFPLVYLLLSHEFRIIL